MVNNRTLALIKRELRVRLFSKTFLLMTFLIPLFMFGIIGIQALIYSLSEEQNPVLVVITESIELMDAVEYELSSLPESKDGRFVFMYETGDEQKFEKRLGDLRVEILKERLSGVLYIPSLSLSDKKIKYYSANPANTTLFQKIRPAINKALIKLYFADKDLSRDDIEFARTDVDISGFRITKDDKVEEAGIGNMILLFLLSFLLYMALIFTGQMTMNAVVEEKSSKIVEVLLSSASSIELMTGKIIGTVIIGVLQMSIWMLPVFLVLSTTWFVLPAEIIFSIDGSYVFYFLFNYLIALITFVGLFAAVGAIFDNPQDAQSGIWPLLMLIMIPFFIALSLQGNPQSDFARIASMFPFASLMVMPARMTLVDVPVWQILVSIAVNITVMLSIFPAAGKIYRVGILVSGKKPKWSEVVKWLRYKY